MAIDQSNRFECSDCGVDMLESFVSYDAFGYAICPFCETDTEWSDDGAQPERLVDATNSDSTESSTPVAESEWRWGVNRPTN